MCDFVCFRRPVSVEVSPCPCDALPELFRVQVIGEVVDELLRCIARVATIGNPVWSCLSARKTVAAS